MKLKVLFTVLTSFILLTIHLGSWGIVETSEARYAEISKEMLESGDYVHPTLMGIQHYHKPPLTYYITTLGYKLFGVNEFGARFFLQIAIVLQLLLIYGIGLLLFNNKKTAFTAMLIYFSLPLVLISSRNLTTDAYLTTSVLASLFFWLSYRLKGLKKINLYLFFITLGIGFEVKGPIGLIFILLFILNYYFITKEKIKLSLHHALGFLIFLSIAFSWYIIVVRERPTLGHYFFEEQLIERIVSESYHRGKSFWFYLMTVPLIGLPWMLFLAHQSTVKFSKARREKSREYVLLWTLLTIVLVFSLFKTKLILYVLPAFGFVSLLTAQFLSNTEDKTLSFYNKTILIIAILFSASLVVLSFYKIPYDLNRFLALTLGTLCILAFLFPFRRNRSISYSKTVWLGYVFSGLILIAGNDFMTQNQGNLNSTKPVMEFVNTQLKDINTIYVYNYLLPSAQFYSKKKIVTLNNGHNTVQRETQFETNDLWKSYNLDLRTEDGKFQAMNGLKNHAMLITRKKDLIKEDLHFLIKNFHHTKEFGVWRIYY